MNVSCEFPPLFQGQTEMQKKCKAKADESFSTGYTSAAAAFNGCVPFTQFSVGLLHFMNVEERACACVRVCLWQQTPQARPDSTSVLSSYEEQRGAARRSRWPRICGLSLLYL